jgi:methionyl-tRNA formyltransferase/MoaA/NifB/PqqE/SkfB family radical SAM enzyme
VRCVLFGLSGFGNEALRALRRAGAEVALVLTRREPGPFPYYDEKTLADEARELGIEVVEDADVKDLALKRRVDLLAPELVVAATFTEAIPSRFLGAGRVGLALHPSLLPAYRGATPTTWILINRDFEACGVTLHHLTGKAFTGDVVAQRKVGVDAAETDGSLRRKLALAGGELLHDAVAALRRGDPLPAAPQDESRITFFPKRTRRDGLIKFDEPTANILDRIRATSPWPGAWTYDGERELEIREAAPEPALAGSFEIAPGLIVRAEDGRIVVKTRDGALRLRVEPEIAAAELAQGSRVLSDGEKVGIKRSGPSAIVHTREVYGIDKGAEEFPKMVVLATVYPCNARCPNCPYTEGNSDIRLKYADAPFMDEALFRKIADECGQYGAFVRITGGGEPMMHPADMVSLIEHAKGAGAKVWLNTNGSQMPDPKLERLLACGLDQVEFSVDAGDPDTYAIVRAGLDWNNLVRTVRTMVERRNASKSGTNIVVSVINQDIVKDQMDDIVRFWLELGVDEVIKRKFLTWGSNTALDAGRSADPTPYLDKTEGEPCPYPFHRLNIDSRGKVEVCGFDISGRTNLGNVRQQTIREIWQGPMFQWWREKHASGCGGDIPLCRECPDWQYRSWTHNWEKVMRTAEQHRLRVIEWAESETGGSAS